MMDHPAVFTSQIVKLEEQIIAALAAVKEARRLYTQDRGNNAGYWGTLAVNANVLQAECRRLVKQTGHDLLEA
jgi:hypothetical protein